MINLLPPQEQESLLLEKKRKLAIILGIITIACLLALSLVLFSVKYYLLQEESYHRNILDGAGQTYETADFLSLKTTIKKYNTTLTKLDAFYENHTYFSKALKTFLQIPRPAGVSVVNLALTTVEKNGNTKFVISGVSDTRDHLLALKDAIEKNPNVQNSYFPPDSWIKSSNINFFISLEIVKQP